MSFPTAPAGDEENFRALQKERHKATWGSAITPKAVYGQHHSNWDAFASVFTHQAFLLTQLKAIYDNVAVVLRVLAEEQCAHDPDRVVFDTRRFDDDVSAKKEAARLDHQAEDPFAYFLDETADYALRRVFLQLFTALATERRDYRRGVLAREIARSVLENAYDFERMTLVERLTSQGSAVELNGVGGSTAPTAQAAIWRVRRQIVLRESAMYKALVRLRELMEEDWKKAEAQPRRGSRSCVRGPRRDRSWEERSLERSPVRERRVDFGEQVYPIRERRRARSPPESDEGSVEIVEKLVDEA